MVVRRLVSASYRVFLKGIYIHTRTRTLFPVVPKRPKEKENPRLSKSLTCVQTDDSEKKDRHRLFYIQNKRGKFEWKKIVQNNVKKNLEGERKNR